MIKYHTVKDKIVIAELIEKETIVNEVQDILDLIADAGQNESNRVIIYEHNLNKDFFDLKTRLAGEILQKISNYRFRMAIIGDFTKYKSRSLQDFIWECNRGKMIAFVSDLKSALEKL
jgi:hypothetical protein